LTSLDSSDIGSPAPLLEEGVVGLKLARDANANADASSVGSTFFSSSFFLVDFSSSTFCLLSLRADGLSPSRSNTRLLSLSLVVLISSGFSGATCGIVDFLCILNQAYFK
jgi:hypothetical protein